MRERRFRGLHTVVTCAALLMFARLTLRHVGDAAFLEDQVDQLQNFESLLRLRPEGLWGAIMSGTVPPAHALGPLGAIVFGVPVWLGLGIEAIHVVTSLLIAVATAACFAVFARIDTAFAWLWLLVVAATSVVWWNAAMLWSNTLLLPIGLTLAALAASCLQRPDRATCAWLVVTLLAALHLHLVAVVAVPIVVIVGAVTIGHGQPLRGRAHVWMLAATAALAVSPYVAAEVATGFANTRAILGHLQSSEVGSGRDASSASAALAVAFDPTRVLETLGLNTLLITIAGGGLALAALAAVRTGPLSWLVVCAVAGIVGQALFFLWMSRPFAGYHHVTLLVPFYAVPPAIVLRRVLFGAVVPLPALCAAGGAVLTFLVLAGPSIADRSAEPTPWSYERIRAALDALCGDLAVDTDEGAAFAPRLNPQYDSVLRYMMKRGLTTCRYQRASDVVIAAARDAQYPAAKTIGDEIFYRELVLPPGIARYRRAR
jgi:hypothetical protein